MKRKFKVIKESAGAGFSVSSGARNMFRTRGGFGGASNLGGATSMYTYEIKPLNHILEPKSSVVDTTLSYMRLGSKISAVPIRTNATPTRVRITGILQDIVKTADNAVKYYVIFDENTARQVKVDPLTARLIIEDPVEKQFPASDIIPSSREKKIKEKVADMKKKQLVSENLYESKFEQKFNNYEELMQYLEDTLKIAVGWSSATKSSIRIFPMLKPGASQWDKNSAHNSIGITLENGEIWLSGFSGYDLEDIAAKLGCRKTNSDPQGGYYSAKFNDEKRNYVTKIKESDLENLISRIRGGVYAEGKRQTDFYRGSSYGRGSGVGDF